MTDINTIKIINNVTAFDDYCRAVLGAKCTGVSYGGSGPALTIHLQNELQADVNLATSILSNYQTLIVDADKATIAAHGLDVCTISCAALGNDFDYVVFAPDGTIASGSVADGTLNLSTVAEGLHHVELREQGGQYRTGIVIINGVA